MKNEVTNRSITKALGKCLKMERWGYYAKCPLCKLFNGINGKGAKNGGCQQCRERLGYVGCEAWIPPGQSRRAATYWQGMIKDKEKERDWRSAANLAIKQKIQELKTKPMKAKDRAERLLP